MARYGLFVLKVPLNPNQPTYPRNFNQKPSHTDIAVLGISRRSVSDDVRDLFEDRTTFV